uniref:CID domain-containing protein n=1 Tax=Leersia perrieri TaxID=77586 RepID=A0A0D9V9R0_9ORYZ
MNAGFSPQILAQKLSKLNNSRQSIETPRERRVSLLYLANDIVQNSKKDSGRYVNEFWRVIPAALNDVFVNGDEFGRNVVQRLVDIWEERNIFGSHGQSLKEDYSRRFRELKSKSRNSSGELLEKVISCYKHMVNAHVDEDTLMRRCQNALSFVDNLSNEYENNSILDSSNGSGFVEELQAQHSILRDIIEQFKTSELLRGNLISCLKEALHEQEFRMERARSQIKEVQSRYKKADDLCQKLGVHVARQEPPNHGLKISGLSETPGNFAPDSANASSFEKGQSSAVMYSQENGGEHEITNGILSSRATGDNMEQKVENSTSKRLKLQNDVYVSQPQSPPPPLPSDAFQQPPPPPEHPPPPESTSPPPPPTSDPPPVPPPPPTTDSFMPVPAGPTTIPYNSYPAFSPLSYPMVNIPPPFPSAPNPPPGFRESILCPSFSRTTTTTSTTDEQEID